MIGVSLIMFPPVGEYIVINANMIHAEDDEINREHKP